MRIIILGAGLSGLIANYKLKQKGHNPLVLEASGGYHFPSSQGAFYCNEKLDDQLTPPESSFDVIWKVEGNLPESQWKTQYALKVYRDAKMADKVSIQNKEATGWAMDLSHLRDDISFNTKVTKIDVNRRCLWVDKFRFKYDILITTIPMPIFMSLSEYPKAKNYKFIWMPIYIREMHQEISGDNMSIQYYPGSEFQYYRATTWAHKRSEEGIYKFDQHMKTVRPGKIFAQSVAPDYEIYLKSNKIVSAGRYAKWIPKYFVHNVFNDITEDFDEVAQKNMD